MNSRIITDLPETPSKHPDNLLIHLAYRSFLACRKIQEERKLQSAEAVSRVGIKNMLTLPGQFSLVFSLSIKKTGATMSTFAEFAQKNLVPLMPLVFVLVVLSQALLKVIKTFFIRPKINVYPTGPLSIGLSQLGSTLTLFGTLQVQRGDCFVTKMEAFVWNNSWSRTFEWRALQPYTFSLLPNQENLQLELVSAFLLTPQSPFKYNLVFVDERLTKQCMPEVLKLRQRWEDAGQPDITAFMEKEEAVAHLLTRLQQEWYWQPGTYQLTLKIHTARKIHEKTYQFELTQAQLIALQGNFTKLAKLICDQPVKFDKVKCEYHQGYSADAK